MTTNLMTYAPGGVGFSYYLLQPTQNLFKVLHLLYLRARDKCLRIWGMDQFTEVELKNQHSFETVGDQLRSILDEYFKNFPKVSVAALAKRSQVSATTLRRILLSEKPFTPSPHIVLNLLSYLKKEKNLSKLLDLVDGPAGELLQSCFSKFIFEDTPHIYDYDLNQVLSDKTNYLIYKLAANKTGTHRTVIQQMLGDRGIKKLEKLLEKGVVYTDNDHKIHAQEKNFSLDLELMADHLPELVKFFKPEEVNLGKNVCYSISESLNQDAIDQILKIQTEAVKKIHQIMQDEQNHGIYPYFSINLSDTLLIKQINGVLQ
jgi:hypothetical protein